MEINGTYRLPSRRDVVWTTLGDPKALLGAIPGCEKVEPLANGDIRIVLAVEVGSFRSTFTGQARLEASDPPASATIAGEGRGRPAGSAEGRAEITLTEDGPETIVTYAGTIRVGGRLRELPEPVIAAKAREMADQFFAGVVSSPSDDKAEDDKAEFVDRLDHAPAGVPTLGDEPSENVVEDPAERAAEVVREVEDEIEVAAGRNFLGGPVVWGVLVLMVLVAAYLIF